MSLASLTKCSLRSFYYKCTSLCPRALRARFILFAPTRFLASRGLRTASRVRCSTSLRSLEHLTRLAVFGSLRSPISAPLQHCNSSNAPRTWVPPDAKCARARCARATTETPSVLLRSLPIFQEHSTFIMWSKKKLRFCVRLVCEKKKATALHDIDLQLHALVQCFIRHSVNSQVFYLKQKRKHS